MEQHEIQQLPPKPGYKAKKLTKKEYRHSSSQKMSPKKKKKSKVRWKHTCSIHTTVIIMIKQRKVLKQRITKKV